MKRLVLLSLFPLLACADQTAPATGPYCGEPGYPCSLADVPEDVAEATDTLARAIGQKIFDGEAPRDVAAWVATQDEVVEVDESESAVMFRLDGGYPSFTYVSPDEMPDIFSISSTTSTRTGGLIVRRDQAPSAQTKRALVIDNFAFQYGLGARVRGIVDRIRATRDYRDTIVYRANSSNSIVDLIGFDTDEQMASLDEFEFIWIIGHGAFTKNGRHSRVFSSDACGASGFIRELYLSNRSSEKVTGLSLTGATVTTSVARLPSFSVRDQDNLLRKKFSAEYKEYLVAEKRASKKGKSCDEFIFKPTNGKPSIALTVWAYNSDWFADHYPNGLSDTIIYLSLCQSNALPVQLKGQSAYLGWSQNTPVVREMSTADDLIAGLFFAGERLDTVYERLRGEGLTTHTVSSGTTELQFSSSSNTKLRARDIVELMDPMTLDAFGSAGVLTASHVGMWSTTIEVPIRIRGLRPDAPEVFELSVALLGGLTEPDIYGPLTPPRIAPTTDDATIIARMTLPFRIESEPVDIEIEARLKLPPGETQEADEYSRHRVYLQILPAGEANWRYNIGAHRVVGLETFAPYPQAVMNPDGSSTWIVHHITDETSQEADVNIVLKEHPGRSTACTGPTGTFDATINWYSRDGTLYAGGTDEPLYHPDDATVVLCPPTQVSMTITSFSREEGLRATVQGNACALLADGLGFEVPVSGEVYWPEAGCGPPPMMGNLIGSYVVTDASMLCYDVYPEATIAVQFAAVCRQPELTCMDSGCPTIGQLGECNYRNPGANLAFQGMVVHVQPGPDVVIEDQRMGCTLNGGTWTDGEG